MENESAEMGVDWQSTFGGDGFDRFRTAVESEDGGFVAVGERETSDGDADAWVVKLDSSGERVWETTYGGNLSDHATSVDRTPTGYVVSGYSESLTMMNGAGTAMVEGSETAEDSDAWVIELNGSGGVVREEVFDMGGKDFGCWVTYSGDGGYGFAGFSQSYDDDGVSAFMMELDEGFDEEWSREVDGGGKDYMEFVTPADDGYLFTGRSSSFGDSMDVWTVEVDGSGDVEWNTTVETGTKDSAWYGARGEDGYVVAGNSRGEETMNPVLAKFSPSGDVVWEKVYETGWEMSRSVVETEDGYVFPVSRYPYTSGEVNGVRLVEVDDTGAVRETTTFGNTTMDGVWGMVETGEGYVLAGETRRDGDVDGWMVSLTADADGGGVYEPIPDGGDTEDGVSEDDGQRNETGDTRDLSGDDAAADGDSGEANPLPGFGVSVFLLSLALVAVLRRS